GDLGGAIVLSLAEKPESRDGAKQRNGEVKGVEVVYNANNAKPSMADRGELDEGDHIECHPDDDQRGCKNPRGILAEPGDLYEPHFYAPPGVGFISTMNVPSSHRTVQSRRGKSGR